jgi:hypothetical protein
LIGYGSRLQFPMLSTWADEVYLYEGRTDNLYSTRGWQSVYNLDFYPQRRSFLARLRCLASACGATYREADVANFMPITDWLQQVRRTVKTGDVVSEFGWQTVFVRESSFRLYEKMSARGALPRDCIWCEVAYNERPAPANTMAVLDYLRQHDFGLPLVGIGTSREDHYAFQRRHLREAGEHYMALQLLCSMLRNCFMLCISGSANLFAILPTKNIVLTDRYLQMVVTDLGESEHSAAAAGIDVPAAVVRKLLDFRHGNATERIVIDPWHDPCRALVRFAPHIGDVVCALRNDSTCVVNLERYRGRVA